MITTKAMPTTCRSLGNTLRPLTSTWKRRVRERYQGPNKLDDAARKLLSEAIFAVEDEYEYSLGSNSTPIRTLRAIRNCLLDDMGANENLPGSRYPFIEAVAAVIREKRRKGNPDAFGPRPPGCRTGSESPLSGDAPAIDPPGQAIASKGAP